MRKTEIFNQACSDRTRDNCFTLKKSRFTLDTRKKFFAVWVVRDWKRLPREVVDVPTLEVFEVRLVGVVVTPEGLEEAELA